MLVPNSKPVPPYFPSTKQLPKHSTYALEAQERFLCHLLSFSYIWEPVRARGLYVWISYIAISNFVYSMDEFHTLHEEFYALNEWILYIPWMNFIHCRTNFIHCIYEFHTSTNEYHALYEWILYIVWINSYIVWMNFIHCIKIMHSQSFWPVMFFCRFFKLFIQIPINKWLFTCIFKIPPVKSIKLFLPAVMHSILFTVELYLLLVWTLISLISEHV